MCSPAVELVVKVPELATPPVPLHPPLSPLPKAQPVRGSGYCGHAHFSIMSSSACRKRKPLVQPETLEHSTGDSSLSSALHFLNEIPLPLSHRAVEEGGREGGQGRREECSCRRKKKFFSFSLQSVRELKGGVLEAGRESCRSVDTVKKFVCLLDILFLSELCTLGRLCLQNEADLDVK